MKITRNSDRSISWKISDISIEISFSFVE